MNSSASSQDVQAERRRDFEQQVVCYLLRNGGLIGQLSRFKDERAETSGSRRLTLDWFHRRFPQFPVRLGATLLDDSTSPPWQDIFVRFTKCKFFEAYRRWRKDQGLDDHVQRIGLVFNLDRRAFVLHNQVRPVRGLGTRVVRSVGDPPVVLLLEQLGSLLESIGTEWAEAEN